MAALENSPEQQANLFQPQAEDILSDDELLELFRVVKQIFRKKPTTDRISKVFFCFCYALGDEVKFYKPKADRISFKEDGAIQYNTVKVPGSPDASSTAVDLATKRFNESPGEEQRRAYPVSYITQNKDFGSKATSTSPHSPSLPSFSSHFGQDRMPSPQASGSSAHSPFIDLPSSTPRINGAGFRPPTKQYQSIQPSEVKPDRLYQSPSASPQSQSSIISNNPAAAITRRGFYYQPGRINNEDVLVQRYAEQGLLVHGPLIKKKRRAMFPEDNQPEMNEILSFPPRSIGEGPAKKPKIPHRHGEFESRRDDIIQRLRAIAVSDLEQKASKISHHFSLAIEKPKPPTRQTAEDVIRPALLILAKHSNMKPHLDNGMNQNGIYYNWDYYRLFLAFDQFQQAYAQFYPVAGSACSCTKEEHDRHGGCMKSSLADREKEKNANMKSYRPWIEPLLKETNWAAFRRNIVVGERMMQLTKAVGLGVLLMTKELSGSKIHLTFTNNEWHEFLTGLISGKWDSVVTNLSPEADENGSRLVQELCKKFDTPRWFEHEPHNVEHDETHSRRSSSSNLSSPRDLDAEQRRSVMSITEMKNTTAVS
ncbi:hypothetical protein K450DRAFT_234130 [Umbelopsis ramanniana AG]|uniref:Uncharacterized protein n=1 Tax=Umbelopsis ramanniana AG TaxID=1314678 RepID=A0AAD5EC73_UMBRA|nr:uncharacterized protein K450DRAFT_234130 [Umbelopsis ramanniana AG]KAI8581003.1 hypothetical protein K450DRAFT_234130 [Umbelopsis ramanniana AG]